MSVHFWDQYGFRAGYLNEFALVHILKMITDAWEKEKYVISVMMDLLKAFDTSDHKILMDKTAMYGITSLPHSCLSSYLFSCSRVRKINNILSNRMSLCFGVSQGSILGPLLFLIYINDISSCIQSGALVILHADDCTYLWPCRNLTAAIVNHDLINLANW